MIIIILGLGFLRRPLAIVAAVLTVFGIAFLNDGLLTVHRAFAIGHLSTILHASVRTPSLKARLNTFHEEFRAVFRNYSDL